jgi:hypothetical protein
MADSRAEAAVCPNPHSEASVMVQPTSCSLAASSALHLPIHDALHNFMLAAGTHLAGITFAAGFFFKKAGQAYQYVTNIAVSSNTVITPEPSGKTGRAQIFKGQWHIQVGFGSKCSGCTAKQGSLHALSTAHAACQIIQQVAESDPKGTSYRPGRVTSPERQKSFGPGERSVPIWR